MVTVSTSFVSRSPGAYLSHLITPTTTSVDLLHHASRMRETKLLAPFKKQKKTLYLINEADSIIFLV